MTRFSAALALIASSALADEAILPGLQVSVLPAEALPERGLVAAPLGKIRLPTGRIVAVDPLTALGLRPLELTTPPGPYQVDLVVLAEDRTRPAFAILRTAACTPLLWQPAVPDGEDLSTLQEGYIFGYGVDAGTGSYADFALYESFGATEASMGLGPSYDAFSALILDRMFPDASGIPQNFILPHGEADMAVFSSGWGDGFYGVFWGFSETGCPCALVTDFALTENGVAWGWPAVTRPQGPARYSTDPAETGDFTQCPGRISALDEAQGRPRF